MTTVYKTKIILGAERTRGLSVQDLRPMVTQEIKPIHIVERTPVGPNFGVVVETGEEERTRVQDGQNSRTI